MSFGKRNREEPDVTPVVRKAPRSTAFKLGLLASAVASISLIGAGVYHWRYHVLAVVYPQLLTSLHNSPKQIGGKWIETNSDPRVGESLIRWMRARMATLCRDSESVVPWMAGASVAADEDTLENPGTLPSVYSDSSVSAQQMLDLISARQQDFCAREYYVARFDSRMASLVYMDRRHKREWGKFWNEFESRKAQFEREIAATSRQAMPAYSSDNIDIRERCRRVHPDNYEYRDICERNQEEARLEIRGMDVPDEIAHYCDRVHDDNYEYRRICYRNQMKAKDRRGY